MNYFKIPTMDTLQNLCLETIISEFSIIYQYYCSTKDSCLKLQYEYLKRTFSFHIMQTLHRQRCLKTEYLDFLINKYLRILDTRLLKKRQWETVFQKLAEIGPTLEEVVFTDKAWGEVICYLPNLKRITFLNDCGDRFLATLSKFCRCVETLDVQCSFRVSDNGLKHLCKEYSKNPRPFHASIKELLIDSTQVGDEGVACVLKNMPFLEKIDYYNLLRVLYSMHKCDINAFDKVKPYNLTHMDINNSMFLNCDEFTCALNICGFVCPHIKYLTGPVTLEQHLESYSQLHALEKLHLDCLTETPLELNELLILNWKNLTSLKLSNFSMSLSVLAQNCPHLNLLQMNKVDLQHDVNDSVPMFYNLEKIVLINFNFIEPVIIQAVTCLLSSAPNLYELCFKNCELFSSEIIAQILRCCECKLNILDFGNSRTEYELIKDILVTCSSLKTIYFGGTGDNDVMHGLIATSSPEKSCPSVIIMGF